MVRAPKSLESRRRLVAEKRRRVLRVEELERRYLLFASPADPPAFPSATPLTAVQLLGQNALPATDVLGAAMTFNNAVPWTASQGSVSTLSQSLGGVVMRTDALSAGQLGSLNPFSRSGHGMIEQPPQPQQLEAPKPDDVSAASHLEETVDTIARATTSHSLHARDAAIVEIASAD